MTIVSFKSKYIAVAVVTAIVVSLAVGAILIYANRAQHVALIDSAAADARDRVSGELSLRANETAKRLGDRVAEHVLRGERDVFLLEIDHFKTDATLTGVVLRDLQAERHMAMLLVTHNFGVVADLCDRVSVMQSGRFVEQGPVRAIFNDAQHPYTKALLDAILDEGPARPPLVLKGARA